MESSEETLAVDTVLAGASEPYRMATSPEFTFEWQQEETEAYELPESPVTSLSISA